MRDIKLKLECDCGCSELVVTEFDKEIGLFTVGNRINGFSEAATKIRDIIRKRLKLAWCALRGKDYYFYDIIVQKEDLVKFLNDALIEIESTVE